MMRFIFACLLLSGCGYPYKKAQQQFGKAASTYPELPANYCAKVYPVKTDTVLRGDTVVHFDTIYTGNDPVFDTITVKDTVRITKTVTNRVLVNKQVVRVDTVIRESTAALEACRIDNSRLTRLEADDRAVSDKWRRIARKRFWIIIGMGAGILLGLFAIIKKKVKPIL